MSDLYRKIIEAVSKNWKTIQFKTESPQLYYLLLISKTFFNNIDHDVFISFASNDYVWDIILNGLFLCSKAANWKTGKHKIQMSSMTTTVALHGTKRYT